MRAIVVFEMVVTGVVLRWVSVCIRDTFKQRLGRIVIFFLP